MGIDIEEVGKTTEFVLRTRCHNCRRLGRLVVYETSQTLLRATERFISGGWELFDPSSMLVGLICPACKLARADLIERRKRDRTYCEHTPKHPVWHAADGDVVVCKMTDEHLYHAINFAASMMDAGRNKVSAGEKQMEKYGQPYNTLIAEKGRRARQENYESNRDASPPVGY